MYGGAQLMEETAAIGSSVDLEAPWDRLPAQVVPLWMSRREVCTHLGVSVRTLRRLCKRDDIERRLVDRKVVYRLVTTLAELKKREGVGEDNPLNDPPRTPPVLPKGPPPREEGDDEKDLAIPIMSGRPRRASDREAQRLLSLAKAAIAQRDRAQKDSIAHKEQLAQSQTELLKAREEGEEADARLQEAQARGTELEALLERVETSRNRVLKQNQRLADQLDKVLEQRDRAIEQRDGLLERLDKVLEQRDLAISQRDTVMEQLDVVVEQRDNLADQFQQAYQLLLAWSEWRDHAQMTLDRADDRCERAIRLAAAAANTPWWAFARRKEIEADLQKLAAPFSTPPPRPDQRTPTASDAAL